MRLSSITDQIFIKAQRIRTIEVNKSQKIGDDIVSEYVGIINYCIIGQIQLLLSAKPEQTELSVKELEQLYDSRVQATYDLMLAKNHDYGEAWRDMRISSLTDLILTKLLRVKQIEDNGGVTVASEGIDANYMDMMNYSVFALIKLEYYK
jgi:uncharacterized membrane protein